MGLSPTGSIARLRRMATARLAKRLLRLASVVLLLALPVAARAQRVAPYLGIMPWAPSPGLVMARWSLPSQEQRRATIVAALPVPERYRVCNESNTTAVVETDSYPGGFDLPGRTCMDLAARTITITQRASGIAPFGSYAKLD